jgi:hypothetical protein
MKLAEPPLPPEIWAATPCAAQALIVALQARIRELEARHQVVELLPLAVPWAGEPGPQSGSAMPGAEEVVAGPLDLRSRGRGRADQQCVRARLATGGAVAQGLLWR